MTEKSSSKKYTNRIFRLAPPLKKGILRMIFSRFFLIMALLLVQLALIVVVYVWLYHYIAAFRIGTTFFTLLMIIYLFVSEIDATAKLTWMLIIAIMPIPGTILLLYTKINAGHRLIQRREGELIEETKDALPKQEKVMEILSCDGADTDDLVKYLCLSGCFPPYANTDVRYFPSGEEKFAAMLRELRSAKKFIFLEYFIIEEGYMWGEILQILLDKAAAGVEVRVMYDGMCEISTLPMDYWTLLEKRGILSKPFSPIKPLLSSHYNYRDHRKILVIDGRVAFTGGVNLADEYINVKPRFGHWKDAAVMLRGEAVKSFTLLFLQMWNIDEKNTVFHPYLRETFDAPQAEGYVIPYGDCPLDDYRVGETVYMDILNRAGSYVHFITPYLILDGELENCLKYAAQRGVDVKLILPGIPDKKLAYALAKSHYTSLVRAGVKIYEYTPGFVHAKVCTSDDKKAVVGTINLDYRSLYHHFECAAYLYQVPCIREIEQDFQETLAKCREVTPETIRHEALYYKVMGALMKFIAPLM